MGWYVHAVVAAEVTLCVAGLRIWAKPRWQAYVAASGVLLFALLDLYTMNAVSIPYYTGMVAHRANGSLAAVHWDDFGRLGAAEVFSRLAEFKPPWVNPPVVFVLWLFYLLATFALIGITFYLAGGTSRRNPRAITEQERVL